MTASLFKLIQIPISRYGRPHQRRALQPRVLPRLALRQPRHAEPNPHRWHPADKPIAAFHRAAAYALQRTDNAGRSVALATAAEGILQHALDPRAALLRAGFTRRQVRRLIQKYRATGGVNGTR